MSSCFDRLGIPPTSTEKEIRKAYKRAAVQVHPDKVAPQYKEQATAAFRELHTAYQECLDRCRNGNASSHSHDGYAGFHDRPPATDADIRKAFDDVCADLDQELENSRNATKRECMVKVEQAWPNMEKCFHEAKSKLLIWEVKEMAEYIRPQCPQLADYFLYRLDENSRNFEIRQDQENRANAERFHNDWNCCKYESLKTWVKSWKTPGWNWRTIAEMQPNGFAAHAIRSWRREYDAEFAVKRRKGVEEAARKIIQAFPNINTITEIIRKESRLDRSDIYALLPDQIRLALTNGDVGSPCPRLPASRAAPPLLFGPAPPRSHFH